MSDDREKYFYKLCRLCLHESECFHDIFKANGIHGFVAADVIAKLLDSQVSKDDGYPRVICMDCLKKLNAFNLMSKYRDFTVSPSFMLFKDQYLIAKSTFDYAITQSDKSPDDQHSPVSMGHSPLNLNLEEIGLEGEVTPQKPRVNYVLEAVASILRDIKCDQDELPVENPNTPKSKSKVDDRRESLTASSDGQERSDSEEFKRCVSEDESWVPSDRSAPDPDEEMEDVPLTLKLEDVSFEEEEFGSKEPSDAIGKPSRGRGQAQRSSIDSLKKHRIPDKRKYQCDICRRRFVTKMEMGKHGEWHIKMKALGPYKEEHATPRRVSSGTLKSSPGECNMERKYKGYGSTKFDTLSARMRYGCNQCGKRFKLRNSLVSHLKTHERTVQYVCDDCGLSFGSRKKIVSHVKVHNRVRRFGCEECGRYFRLRGDLIKHLVVHTDVKEYVCHLCGREFAHLRNLKFHLRLHSGVKPFVCNVCGKGFYDRTSLNTHKTTHNRERPFPCEQCDKSFTRKALLLLHVKTHEGVRPYECRVCGSTFTQRSDLTKHGVVHTGEKNFPCSVCGKKFAHKRNLKEHQKIHEGRKHRCADCGSSFVQMGNLRTHMQKGCEGGRGKRGGRRGGRRGGGGELLKVKIEGI